MILYKKNILTKKIILIYTIVILMITLGGYLLYNNIPSKNINNNVTTNTTDKPLEGNSSKEQYDQTINKKTEKHEKQILDETNLVNNVQGVPVLYYHSVRSSADNEVTISPKMLRSELKYLKDSGYTSLTISELGNYLLNNSPIPKKSILITFDDGYMDNYDNAFPILKELDLKATIFCITCKLDGSYYLSKNAIKEMSDYGIDIQSHTVNHAKLDTMTYNEQLTELKKSKETLESITGKHIISIAYPYGQFNDDTVRAAKNAGYSLGFTTNKGLANKSDNPLKLNRIYVSSNYNLETFKQILSSLDKTY